MAAKTLDKAELRKIEEAHAKGEPLPTGVTFAPYNKPPYVATEEYFKRQEELAGTGQFGGGEVLAGPVDGSGS